MKLRTVWDFIKSWVKLSLILVAIFGIISIIAIPFTLYHGDSILSLMGIIIYGIFVLGLFGVVDYKISNCKE